MFDFTITSKMRKLFEFLKNYENCFDFENTKILFEHEDQNHVINFVFDVESLYESLYILFKIEFTILKNYLLKISNRIRKFTSRASASMLFVF